MEIFGFFEAGSSIIDIGIIGHGITIGSAELKCQVGDVVGYFGLNYLCDLSALCIGLDSRAISR